jgi:hypothetical protein
LRLRLAAALVALAGAAQAQCLEAEKAGTVLEGRLEQGRFRNYEGRMAPAFILHLAKPACLEGDAPEDKVDPTRLVHVYSLQQPMLERLRGHVGKAVRVEGRPFGQVSYHHHHAPIVMDVVRIERR